MIKFYTRSPSFYLLPFPPSLPSLPSLFSFLPFPPSLFFSSPLPLSLSSLSLPSTSPSLHPLLPPSLLLPVPSLPHHQAHERNRPALSLDKRPYSSSGFNHDGSDDHSRPPCGSPTKRKDMYSIVRTHYS